MSEAAGVGWVVGENVTGVAVVACRDPEAGTLTEDAAAIVTALRTYNEVSPSGTGVRAFALGDLPATGRKRGAFEMYDGNGGRYLTVTQYQLDGTPDESQERGAELAVIHARHIARPEPKASTNGERRGARVAIGKGAHLSDPEVLARMRKPRPAAAVLYDGVGDGHPGQRARVLRRSRRKRSHPPVGRISAVQDAKSPRRASPSPAFASAQGVAGARRPIAADRRLRTNQFISVSGLESPLRRPRPQPRPNSPYAP